MTKNFPLLELDENVRVRGTSAETLCASCRQPGDLLVRGDELLCTNCRRLRPYSEADSSVRLLVAKRLARAISFVHPRDPLTAVGKMSDTEWAWAADAAGVEPPSLETRGNVAVVLFQQARRASRVA